MLKLVLLYQYIYNTLSKCLKHEKTVFIYINIFLLDSTLIKTPPRFQFLTPLSDPPNYLKIVKIRKKQWQQQVYALLRPRLSLGVITSTRRPPPARVKMDKRLKSNLKRVKIPNKLTHMFVSLLLNRNFSKDGKQWDTFQERYLDTYIISSKQRMVLSMGQ